MSLFLYVVTTVYDICKIMDDDVYITRKITFFFLQGGLEASEKKKRSSGFVFSRFTNLLSSLRRKTCHPTKFTAFSIPENEELEPSAASMANTIGNSFIQRNSNSSFYIEKTTTTTTTRSELKVADKDVSNEQPAVDDIEDKVEDNLTDVEKVLSRCSDKEIIPFETMYEPARLSKALKVST